jgi:hypothetical protein
MALPEIVRVTGPGRLRGTVDTAAWPMDGSRAQVLVRIEGGTSVLVPLEALVRQDDGSYPTSPWTRPRVSRAARAAWRAALPWCCP